jgi:hypothetical protein
VFWGANRCSGAQIGCGRVMNADETITQLIPVLDNEDLARAI